METTLTTLKKGVLHLIFLLPLSPLSHAEVVAEPDKQSHEVSQKEKYVVGHLNHPRVNSFYKPLIERAYRDIGIEIVFETVGGERGLRLLNEGMTDADVIRYDVVSQADNNIVIVPPALSHGASFLLCIRGAECNKDIIQNPDKAIAATTRFFINMRAKPGELNANIFEFDDFNHVIGLLLNGRFDYAIMPSDFSEKAIFEQSGIEYIPLVKHELVHVINKKHAHLVDDLSASIAKQLALLDTEETE